MVTRAGAVDAEAVARRQVRQVDIRPAAGLAEDQKSGARLLAPVGTGEGRTDDEVGEPVAVDVAGSSDREPALARRFAVETNPLAWRQIGQIDVGSRIV